MEPELTAYHRNYCTDRFAGAWAGWLWPKDIEAKKAELIEKANARKDIKYGSMLYIFIRNAAFEMSESSNQGREEK